MMKEVRAPSLTPPPLCDSPHGQRKSPPAPPRHIHPLEVEQISRRSDHHFFTDAHAIFLLESSRGLVRLKSAFDQWFLTLTSVGPVCSSEKRLDLWLVDGECCCRIEAFPSPPRAPQSHRHTENRAGAVEYRSSGNRVT